MNVSIEQVRAFRIAAHGLAQRHADPHATLSRWATQDSPPGAAATALSARHDLEPGWLDEQLEGRNLVALYNPRSATAIVATDQVAAYATGFLPHGEEATKAMLKTALPQRQDGFEHAAQLAIAAIADALDGRRLSRDVLHEELRQRLPIDMLPWCRSCQSHHARRGLLNIATLHGRLCISGRVGRQPEFARTDQHVGWNPPKAGAGAELVRRYLGSYGPSIPADFSDWAGIGSRHANELWSRIEGELTLVRIDSRKAWLLEADRARLEDPPNANGIRLIGPGDPLLLDRDRETLVPDEATRKQVWKAIGGAGLILADGEPAGIWRARKKGEKLTIEATTDLPLDEILEEAERLAPHRGATAVELPQPPASTTR